MAHGLDVVGSGMLSVREVPWHAHPSCKVLPETVGDMKEAIKVAACDWEVEKRQLFLGDGRPMNQWAIVRKDTDTILNPDRAVGKQYTPLQNAAAFDWFQPFVDSKEIQLETAGCLWGGQTIWVMAVLNRRPLEIVKGDEVKKYLMVSNGHDGLHAVRVGFTPTRVVCANTLAMAHGKSKGNNLLRIKHHKDVAETLEDVREIVNTINAQFEATAEQFQFLASKKVNATDLEKYVKIVLKMTPNKETGELSTRSKNILERIKELFESGRGADMGRGSYWNAYNAITDYLTHERGHNVDTRLESLWFGESGNMNQLALETAMAMAV